MTDWSFCASLCLCSTSAFLPPPNITALGLVPISQHFTLVTFSLKNQSDTLPSGVQGSPPDLSMPPEPGLTGPSHITSHTSPELTTLQGKPVSLLHHIQSSFPTSYYTRLLFIQKTRASPWPDNIIWLLRHLQIIFMYLINNLLQSLLLFYSGNHLRFSFIIKSTFLNRICL